MPLMLQSADAFEAQNHENIVSLMVEETLMNTLSDEVTKYAERIQSQLSNTRAVIFTYPRDVSPRMIAATNERLYFSGLPDHGRKTQKLVGTILIGHLPLPVVHRDNQSFLSLFPYTDFLEPHFVWDATREQYHYRDVDRSDIRPEVWHSVIDPNTGDAALDATKIRDFFARVYDFDAKK